MLYIVAPDSKQYVVLVYQRFRLIRAKSMKEAEQIAREFQTMGMETSIQEEWDTIEQPVLLLPLEAESLKAKKL